MRPMKTRIIPRATQPKTMPTMALVDREEDEPIREIRAVLLGLR